MVDSTIRKNFSLGCNWPCGARIAVTSGQGFRHRGLIGRIAAVCAYAETLFHLIERALTALEFYFRSGNHQQVGADTIAHAGELQIRIGALRVRPRVRDRFGGTAAKLHIPTVDLRKAVPLSGELMRYRIHGHARIPTGDDHRQISAAVAPIWMQSALSSTARHPDGTCTVNRPCGSLNVCGFCAYIGENAATTKIKMARIGMWIPEGQWSPEIPYRALFRWCDTISVDE